MGITALLDAPIFSGTSVTSAAEVPSRLPVALDGRAFQTMMSHQATEAWGTYYKHESLPLLRDQADQSNLPGEQSVAPNNLWRRAGESWHAGSGQSYFDRSGANNYRFHTSKGVDPWTKWQLSLLPDTAAHVAASASFSSLTTAGSRLYFEQGGALKYCTALGGSNTAVTGITGSVVSVCSDGKNVWAAAGGNGIYKTDTTSSAATSYATGTVTLVDYVKGRLLAADSAGSIYEITATGALPAALLDLSAKGFQWVGFAGGQTRIYAAGYAGDKSLIYSTAVKQDGTTLDVPVVAGELPDGEIVRAISGYLGFILVGTDKGLRLGVADSNGYLTFGAIIPTTSSVQCFEGQDRFVWYGLSAYDATSTGLGRMDLTTFTTDLTPAYASDLMVTAQNPVTSVATFSGVRVFAVSGTGIYYQAATKVASGTLTTGYITYGIADQKGAGYVDLRHEPLHGTVNIALAVDGGSPVALDTSVQQNSTQPPQPISCAQVNGERFELTITLNRNGSDTTQGPVLTRWVLRSVPKPSVSSSIMVPLALFERVLDNNGNEVARDVATDYQFLRSLWASKKLFIFQEGTRTYRVTLEDFEWLPQKQTSNGKFFQGAFVVKLKESNP